MGGRPADAARASLGAGGGESRVPNAERGALPSAQHSRVTHPPIMYDAAIRIGVVCVRESAGPGEVSAEVRGVGEIVDVARAAESHRCASAASVSARVPRRSLARSLGDCRGGVEEEQLLVGGERPVLGAGWEAGWRLAGMGRGCGRARSGGVCAAEKKSGRFRYFGTCA